MQKKVLLYGLAGLCILLLAANVYCLGLIVQKTFHKTSPGAGAQPQAQTASQMQMTGILKNNAEPRSIGTQAGEAVGDLRNKSEKTYQDLSSQAQKTKEQLSKTTAETGKVLNERLEKAKADLEVFAAQLLESINRELEKFQEALKEK